MTPGELQVESLMRSKQMQDFRVGNYYVIRKFLFGPYRCEPAAKAFAAQDLLGYFYHANIFESTRMLALQEIRQLLNTNPVENVINIDFRNKKRIV